jgi:hypothetical protein
MQFDLKNLRIKKKIRFKRDSLDGTSSPEID